MTRLVAASATDIGRVRSQNQDCALVADSLVAVADGMGGHAGGDVAARMAVEVLASAFERQHSTSGLVAAAREANQAILDRSERERALRGMGTTLSAAAVVADREGEHLAVIHVGDSRVYLRRKGALTQLTDDHSLVEEMVRHGELSPDEAAIHPQRHILTRALGIERGVQVDAWSLAAEPGLRLLLCSDGLTNECSDEEIAQILDANPEPSVAAHALVEAALVHGGNDNVTVVVADLLSTDGAARGASTGASAVAATGDPGRPSPPDPGRPSASPAAPAGAAPVDEARAAGPGGRLATATSATATTAVAAPPAAPSAAPPFGGRARAARSGSRVPGMAPPPRARRTPRPEPEAARSRRVRAERIVTVWSVLFLLLFVGVLGAIAGFTEWYVNSTYFIGLSKGRVAIFQGRPGGFLWFQPKLVEQTGTTPAQVFAPYRPMLEAGMIETSYGDAERVAENLTNVHRFLALPGTSASGSSASSNSATSISATSTSDAGTGTSASSDTTSAPASTVGSTAAGAH